MSSQNGFSLLELLLTMSLVGLLLSLGVPHLHNILRSNAVSVEVNKLIRTVHLAKVEAAKHYREVVVCPSADQAQCADDVSAWRRGWLLFVNLDHDIPARVDQGEPLLLAHRVAEGVLVVANRARFKFHHYALRSTNGTVVFCSKPEPSVSKAVVISYTGRPRAANKRRDGNPYDCKR